MKKRILCLLAALLLLTGCSRTQIGSFLIGQEIEEQQAQQQAEPQQEMAADAVMNEAQAPDILRLAYQKDYGLNPFSTISLNNRTLLSLLYEPLFVVDRNYEAVPVLAVGATVSDDGLTTTVKLQSGVFFHSGQSMTAADVVYSYTVAAESDYYGNRFYYVDTVQAQDAYTVVITTETACESVPLLFDFPIVRKDTGADPIPDGTGPFVYDGKHTLARFDRWRQAHWFLPYDTVELTEATTAADIRDHYEYGDVNLVCTDPGSAAYAAFHNDYELWSSPTTVMQYIGFNHNSKVFGVDAVRSCITYAINRSAIVAEDLGGFGLAATLPASPDSPCYHAGLAADYEYDMAKFRAVLDNAKIKDYTEDGLLDIYIKDYSEPLEGTMIVNNSSNQRVQTAEHIADYLNKAGFHITVRALDEDDYRRVLKSQNFDLYYGEIRMSPNFDMGSFFRSAGSANYGGSASATGLNLCLSMLENSGNAYDLHKWIMDKGWLCPVLFKSYAVYTTRGAANGLDPALDWVIH